MQNKEINIVDKNNKEKSNNFEFTNSSSGNTFLNDLMNAKKNTNIDIDFSVLSNRENSFILERAKRFQFLKKSSNDKKKPPTINTNNNTNTTDDTNNNIKNDNQNNINNNKNSLMTSENNIKNSINYTKIPINKSISFRRNSERNDDNLNYGLNLKVNKGNFYNINNVNSNDNLNKVNNINNSNIQSKKFNKRSSYENPCFTEGAPNNLSFNKNNNFNNYNYYPKLFKDNYNNNYEQYNDINNNNNIPQYQEYPPIPQNDFNNFNYYNNKLLYSSDNLYNFNNNLYNNLPNNTINNNNYYYYDQNAPSYQNNQNLKQNTNPKTNINPNTTQNSSLNTNPNINQNIITQSRNKKNNGNIINKNNINSNIPNYITYSEINNNILNNNNNNNLNLTNSSKTHGKIRDFINPLWAKKTSQEKILLNSSNLTEIENTREHYFNNQCNPVLEYSFLSTQNIDFQSSMEDKSKTIENFRNKPNQILFEIFDGHGGDEVSSYLLENLNIIYKVYLSKSKNNIFKSIHNTFLEVDDDIKENINPIHQGSTATLVHVILESPNKLLVYTGNVGDSRVSLISPFEIQRLSKDHRVGEEEEKKRIESNGGKIIEDRIDGELMVTRAFGDFEFKEKEKNSSSKCENGGKNKSGGVVICEPFVSKNEINLEVGNQFLVFASDGIWDVLTEEDIQLIVRDHCNSNNFNNNCNTISQKLCADILKTALEKGAWDNISLFVIRLT